MSATAEPATDELLTSVQVAELCGVSVQSVRRWRFDGDLPYYRLGYRTVRYRREDVDELLASRTVHNRFVSPRPDDAPRPIHGMSSIDDD